MTKMSRQMFEDQVIELLNSNTTANWVQSWASMLALMISVFAIIVALNN